MVSGWATVLLVSHRPHICEQVRLSVESAPGLVFVGEAGNYANALEIAAVEGPDFIVVDVAVDDDGGLDHISQLVQVTKHVLVISDICEETLMNCVRRAGATDLVPREQVVDAIVRRLDPERERIATLTGGDSEIIVLLAKGLSDEQIAQRLCVTAGAVREHFCSACSKLSVEDRLGLLIYAFLNGLAVESGDQSRGLRTV